MLKNFYKKKTVHWPMDIGHGGIYYVLPCRNKTKQELDKER